MLAALGTLDATNGLFMCEQAVPAVCKEGHNALCRSGVLLQEWLWEWKCEITEMFSQDHHLHTCKHWRCVPCRHIAMHLDVLLVLAGMVSNYDNRSVLHCSSTA
jgi:hypothetical protein